MDLSDSSCPIVSQSGERQMDDRDVVLQVVRELSGRPTWEWSKEHRDDLRGERALPLLCLIGDEERAAVMAEALTARLNPDPAKLDRTPPRLIPSASVDATQVSVEEWNGGPLLPLLNDVVQHLGSDRYGAGKEIPFHTFRLVDWLTRHTMSTLERDQQAPLRSKLLDWYAPTVKEGEETELVGPLVATVAPDTALTVTRLMPRLLSRLGKWLWLHGLRGGEPRWLMRQRFMVPAHSAGFLRFARRLTVDHREYESVEQVKLLLVHAFLRDLRLFYGTGTWRLRRWRRTGYLTIVLSGITEQNRGWELLRLINDVRNQTGEHDPLLVIATATEIADDVELTPTPVRSITATVAAWKRELPWKRQQIQPTARFVAVRLDSPPDRWPPGPAPDRGEYWEPRKVPWFARRWVVAAAVVALVGAVSGIAVQTWPESVPDPCGVAGFTTAAAVLMPDTQECVGYSTGGFIFGNTPKLMAAQKAVFEQNAIAEQVHNDNPRRPIVSVVYFAELTHPDTREGTDDAEAEEMTGLLIHQSQFNKVGNSTEDAFHPVLRIVVANGGYQMRHARRVADEFIAPLAARDPGVMGVVGGGRTVAQTESAIGALGAYGIPILATSLTGDTLPALSPLYFQMVAGNGSQARMVTDYAASLGRSVTVYHPDVDKEPDQYVRSLHDRFVEVGRGNPAVEFRPWRTPSTVQVTCRSDDIAFYAGRETGFTDFLNHVLDVCPAAAQPTVIGDDTITRFIAQGESRRSDNFAGVSIGYVSLANRIVLAGSSCVTQGKPAAGSEPDDLRQLNIFCSGLQGLYNPRDNQSTAWKEFGAALTAQGGNRRWTGERVGIAYDAAGLYVMAAVHNRRRLVPDVAGLPLTRATVAQELREIDCSDPLSEDCFKGVSGRIDFRTGRGGGNRPLAILTIDDLTAVDVNPVCAYRFQDTGPCP